jgi:diacylglycerol O-acyltransferase / wax synthase
MNRMKPVKLLDSAFLHIETAGDAHARRRAVRARPRPGAATSSRASAASSPRDSARARCSRAGRPRLPLALANPFWVTASRVDLDHHVRLHRLPEPGGRRELEDCVARLHEKPLDRSRPLWELHVIEGYAGGAARST